jgi:hypothetical protein
MRTSLRLARVVQHARRQADILAFDFLGDGQSREGRFDARSRLRDALLEVCTSGNGIAQPALQRSVLFCQSSGDFNQAGDSFAKHLDFFVHVAGW